MPPKKKTGGELPTLTPSDEQQAVVQHLLAGDNVVVDACAGSGKSTTILSVARAMPKKRILQITYNAALRKEFKEKVQEYHLNHVDVHTYHSLAVRYFSNEAHTDTGIRHLLSAQTPPRDPVPKYDIVVLDEAQDMTLLYFRLITYFLRFVCPRPERGRPHRIQLLVLGDWMQGLYEFKGADIRFLTKAADVWATCPHLKTPTFQPCILRTSYRITRPMASFVNHVMLGTTEAEPRLLACRDGAPVVYLRHSRQRLERIVVYHILRILEEGDLPSDIFILGASVKGANSHVRKMENALVEQGIPCHVPMMETDKMDDRVIQGKVVFSTFHSVKGRQRKYVFVMGFDRSYFTFFTKGGVEDRCPNTLYVGCTRATHRMFLLENNDHATDQPLRFLKYTHSQMADLDYVDFKGLPQTVFYEPDPEATAQRLATKTHYVTPTDIIKFVSEHVLDIVTPVLDSIFVLVHPGGEASDRIPSVVSFSRNGLYEDVADLNGIALPCMFWDRVAGTSQNVLYTLIGEILNDIKPHEHGFLRRAYQSVDPQCKGISDYLYLANLYTAAQEKLYFKLTQIGRDEYHWLSETAVEECLAQMTSVLGASPMVAHEHVLVHPKMETEHAAIDQALRPFFGDGVGYRFSARLDLVTESTVWEIKCAHMTSIEHRLQVVIYAWLWRMLPRETVFDDPDRAFRLLNIKTGEIYELCATTEQLTTVVVELLRGKYVTPATLNDAEFLKTVKTGTA